MTIREFHIGLELGLQQLNSNLFDRLEDEGRDFILNNAIVSFVNTIVNSPNSASLITSYSDIQKYYSEVSALLSSYTLPYNRTENYIYGELPVETPVDTDGIVQQNQWIVDGTWYKVVTGTGLDLSGYGGPASCIIGDTFKADLGSASVGVTSHTFVFGDIYLVLNSGLLTVETRANSLFTPLTSTYNSTGIGSYKRVKAKVIPAVTLIPITNPDFYEPIRVDAYIDTGSDLTGSTAFVAGNYYRVKATTSTVDLSSVGGYAATAIETIFYCSTSGTVTLPTGTTLVQNLKVPTRIFKNQDIQSILNSSYGTPDTSPICEIVGNELRVYDGQDFTVNKAEMIYLRQPAKVNLEHNVTSDINVSQHPTILKLAIANTISEYMAKNAAATGQMPQSAQGQ